MLGVISRFALRITLFLVVIIHQPIFADGKLNCREFLLGQESGDAASVEARLIATSVDMTNVRRQLEILTGEKVLYMKHRLTDRYSESNKEWARFKIIQYLNTLGLEVKYVDFGEGVNFWTEIQGTEQPNEVLEVTAHYDTYGTSVPGADDNGSGIGALLEIARVFSHHKPKKTIRIVFMDLEEQGFQGSEAHTKRIKEEFFAPGAIRKYLGTYVIDTIGYNPTPNEKHLVVLEIGEEKDFKKPYSYWKDDSNDSEYGLKAAEAYALTVQCAKSICYQFMRFADNEGRRYGMKLSVDKSTAKPNTADHGSFWKKSLPAWLVAAPYKGDYINPEYHRPDDKIKKMNWEYYTRTLGFVVESMALLSDAQANFADDEAVRTQIREIIAQQNLEVTREQDLLDKLENKPVPLYTPTYISGNKHMSAIELTEKTEAWDLVVLVEKNGERGDVVASNGTHKWDTYPSSFALILDKAKEKRSFIFKRTIFGNITLTEAKEFVEWLKNYKKDPSTKIPKDFELVQLADKPENNSASTGINPSKQNPPKKKAKNRGRRKGLQQPQPPPGGPDSSTFSG